MPEQLPIDPYIPVIQQHLLRSRAVVVVAEPGAGKTTRVPPALLAQGRAIVLQPRRAAARSIARRIAHEQRWTAGQEVGWQVRFERMFQSGTRLLLATEGILTVRLQEDPLLSDFATVVIDEFHERSIHADLAIALAKQAMAARSDLRLVVMSATMDAGRVARFLDDCPIVTVPGRRHPVRIQYEPDVSAAAAVERALAETPGSVLCFQPGAAEIARTIATLAAVQLRGADVLPMHGSLSASQQDAVLSPPTDRRRVIVCTNIAETSVTVPGITAVVDSGLEKVARYDAERAIDSLVTERVSQAAADQRAGRAGRTGPGVVWRLWSAADRLRPFRDPEVHRIDMTGVVMDIAGWGGDARTLDWYDAPRAQAIDAARALLIRIGALSETRLTEVGRRMLRLPLAPRLARMVVAADGDLQAIRAAALLSERYQFPSRTGTTASDVLSVLDEWDRVSENIRALASQLASAAASRSERRSTLPESTLRRAILAAYPDRVGKRREPHSTRFLMAAGTGAVLSSESGVRNAGFIVALDLKAPTRATDPESRISLASAIDREWLDPTSSEIEHSIDASGRVVARRIERYDALLLVEQPVEPDPDQAAALVTSEWLRRTPPAADQELLRRIRFAGLAFDIESHVRAVAYGTRSLADIDLSATLPRELATAVDRDAPASIAVPSGRRVPIGYADDGSVSASVKLQELFGLAETPKIGPGKIPLLLALLAPNGRPVQLTRDLRSFWDRTYPEVRKELRGRYPKHPWPEDPWNAVPTHRTKGRA